MFLCQGERVALTCESLTAAIKMLDMCTIASVRHNFVSVFVEYIVYHLT